MESLDAKLIAALRRNGRESVANLSVALGVSRTTIRQHMNRMEADGRILGYTVTLREDAIPRGIRAHTMIAIEGHKADRIIARMYRIAAVQLVHATNGKWDLVAELQTGSVEEIDQALTALREIEGIAASETSILLATRHPSSLRG
ncbi:MAG: Lrp/AsnC family transcriptional regulator [Nitratireductor sp.]|nr:Lrp/AsnC family transcriptional regulator [Nitratireductor sp.]